MTSTLYFLAGALAASALWLGAAAAYYLRARRRVTQIQAAIDHYHKATTTVTAALDRLDHAQHP